MQVQYVLLHPNWTFIDLIELCGCWQGVAAVWSHFIWCSKQLLKSKIQAEWKEKTAEEQNIAGGRYPCMFYRNRT